MGLIKMTAEQKRDWKIYLANKEIEKKAEQEAQKERRAFLKKTYEQNKSLIHKIHKNKNLNFKSMDIHAFNEKKDTYPVYKSTSWNGCQSSEYRLIIVDGEPAYARKSNHWGKFGTNVTVKNALAEGFTQEDIDNADDYGRVGRKEYFWNLDGGDNERRTSQAGYILLRDLIGD